jgi:hypothetical protein
VEDDWSDVGWLGGVVSSPQKKGELWQRLALIYKQTRPAGDLSLSKFDLGGLRLSSSQAKSHRIRKRELLQ